MNETVSGQAMRRFFHGFLLFFETLLVLFYLFFEELVWERLVNPIKSWIEKHIGRRLKSLLLSLSPTSSLLVFGVSLIVAEGFGLAAAPVAILIDPVVGALFYLLKVVFAAFAFWFFAQSKEKLLRFGWFAYLYTRTIEVYEWIKSTQLYKRVKSRLQAIRESIKEYIRKLPKGRVSSLYRDLKKIFKREL